MKSEVILPKQRGKLGIGSHLFLGFILFTVIIVALLWLFQIVFLNTFYKAIKLTSIDQRARQIVLSIDDDERMLDAVRDAVDYEQMNVLVADGSGRRLAVGLSSSNYVFSELQSWKLLALYLDTQRGGGSLYQRYVQSEPDIPDDKFGIVQSSGYVESVLYVYALQNDQGQERLVIIYASIEPVESTVRTLRVQLVVITGIMVLLSVGIALVTAMVISRPIVRMNRSAARLAQGDYDVRFEETGAKETSELAHSLNIAAVELSKVENLRKDLLANVSHDLRTPLTMITGYAEVMRDIPGENTPENVQIIIDEANRLSSMVNNLLDISKLQANADELYLEEVNFTELLVDIVNRYQQLLKPQNFEFEFVYDACYEVYVDRIRMQQVVYNLLNNAVNYSKDCKKIVVKQAFEDGYLRIDIIDQGMGVKKEDLPYIFNRYYKVDKNHQMGVSGSGLGLSIVKTILDAHKMKYGVISEYGKGSDFYFVMPGKVVE